MDHFPSVLQGKAEGFLPVPEIGDDPNGADITFCLHKNNHLFFLKLCIDESIISKTSFIS